MSYNEGSIPLSEVDDKMIGGYAMIAVFLAVSAGIIVFLTNQTSLVEQTLFTQYVIPVVIGFAFIFVVALLANYKALDIVQDHAETIIIWSYLIGIIFFVIAMVGGGFAIVAAGSPFGYFMILIGLLVGGMIAFFWQRIKARLILAAEWLKLASTIVLNEPGMLVLSFVQSVIVAIGVITEGITLFLWYLIANTANYSDSTTQNVIYLITFVYLWFVMFVLYYFDGANTFVSYARLKNVDPKIGQGISAASSKVAAIGAFAFLTALVTFVSVLIRSWANRVRMEAKGQMAQVIMASIIAGLVSIAQWLYHLVSFFTLPSIIIRRNSMREGMSESYNLFQRNLWNVIFADMGFGYGVRIMYIMTGVIAGIFGFGFGYLVAVSAGISQVFVSGIIVGIISLLFGVFVTKFFVRPLYTAFSTTIYVYASEGPDAILMEGTERLKEQIDYSLSQPRASPDYMQRGRNRGRF